MKYPFFMRESPVLLVNLYFLQKTDPEKISFIFFKKAFPHFSTPASKFLPQIFFFYILAHFSTPKNQKKTILSKCFLLF